MKALWVVSYPKSGSTWMRLMLKAYLLETTGDPPPMDGDTSTYFYQICSPHPLTVLSEQGFVQLRPAAMFNMLALYEGYHNSKNSTGIFKSHFASGEFFGIPFFSPFWVDKAIYIHRDPRDVVPSLADHMGLTLEQAVTMLSDEFAQIGGHTRDNPDGTKSLTVPQLISSWSEHVMSWMGRREGSRVSTITTSYEKMHEDTARELRRVLEFCEIPIDDKAVEKAVDAASFGKMQQIEELQGFPEKSLKSEKFFRRGIVGSHKDELPRELIARVEADHIIAMRMLGYV